MKKVSIMMILALAGALNLNAQDQQMAGLRVEDARLGTDVQDREIVGETSTFHLNDRIYLWLKVVGGASDSITVLWKTGDQEYSTNLHIGGSPWRTWAYKTAYVEGGWTVTVTDAAGAVLKEMSFVVEKAGM